MATSPIIILGMHRSGTSVLTRLLENFGVFVGAETSVDWESPFFNRLNEWIFRCGNATWDNPRNLTFMDEMFVQHTAPVLRRHLKGPGRRAYLGLRRYFSYPDIAELDFPWGWKDPRNTFTVGIWRRIFPECRMIHIYRNPVDVAESLRVAREYHMKRERSRFRDRVNEALLRRVSYQISLRIRNIEEGLMLWREYVDTALALAKLYPGKTIDVRYETLLESPRTVLTDLAAFLGLDLDEKRIEQAASKLDVARAFAFLKNQELVDLYSKIKDSELMQRLAYSGIGV